MVVTNSLALMACTQLDLLAVHAARRVHDGSARDAAIAAAAAFVVDARRSSLRVCIAWSARIFLAAAALLVLYDFLRRGVRVIEYLRPNEPLYSEDLPPIR